MRTIHIAETCVVVVLFLTLTGCFAGGRGLFPYSSRDSSLGPAPVRVVNNSPAPLFFYYAMGATECDESVIVPYGNIYFPNRQGLNAFRFCRRPLRIPNIGRSEFTRSWPKTCWVTLKEYKDYLIIVDGLAANVLERRFKPPSVSWTMPLD